MRVRVAFLLVAAVVLGFGATRLEIDNSPRAFVAEPSAADRRLVEVFGSDEGNRIVLLGEGARSPQASVWLLERVPELEAIVGVERVVGPAAAIPPGQRVLVASATADSLVVILAPARPVIRRATLAALDAVVRAHPPPADTELVVVGLPQLDTALDAASREIVVRELPLLVLVTLGLLWWCLGRDLLPPLMLVSGVMISTFGALGWLGVRLDLVLVVLPPLLFAMGVATCLHLVLRWREFAESAASTAVRSTFDELGWPVLWSGVTTMAGFLSLGFAPIAPVRHLGLAAAAGIGLLTLAALRMLPWMLQRWRPHDHARPSERSFELAAQRAGRAIALWAVDHRRWVVVLALLVVAAALLGVPRIRLESDATQYLAADHPVRIDIERIEDAGLAVATVQILVEAPMLPTQDAFRTFEAALAAHPLVLALAGPGTLPNPVLDPIGYHLAAPPLLSTEEGLARVVLAVKLSGLEAVDALRADIATAAREHLGVGVLASGTYVSLLEVQRSLFGILGTSLAATVVTIAVLLVALLRSLRRALVALVPNLWPVACVLGAMGWIGMPLDLASVLVGAMSIGLAVDGSLHVLGGLRRREHELGLERAVVETITITSPVFLLSAVVLGLGFGACALSSFLPTARFGILATAAILLAVVADLVLLPALLVWTGQARQTGPQIPSP